MSRKGFAFSIDAMFAIAIVVILAAAYANLYLVEEADVEAAKSVRQQAVDEALVSFYMGTSSGADDSTTFFTGPPAMKHGYCASSFRLPGGSINEENYCWGIEE